MKKYLFSLLIVAIACFSAQAQKYGFINSGNLIQEISESEKADDKLKGYVTPLMADGEARVKKFEANTQAFYEEVQKGILSQVAIQQRQAALQEEQNSIAAYEKEIQQKVMTKREEILGPILTRVQDAIDAVAKENGYKMIFDSSISNAILFTTESDNIEPAVRSKLGI